MRWLEKIKNTLQMVVNFGDESHGIESGQKITKAKQIQVTGWHMSNEKKHHKSPNKNTTKENGSHLMAQNFPTKNIIDFDAEARRKVIAPNPGWMLWCRFYLARCVFDAAYSWRCFLPCFLIGADDLCKV